jgi:hypothetical protein
VDRLLGEHGLPQDTSATRQEFERWMEARRLDQTDEAALKPLRCGWCLGGEQFQEQMLQSMEGKLGEHHSVELQRGPSGSLQVRIEKMRLRGRRTGV